VQLEGNYYWNGKPLAYYTTAADTTAKAGIHFEHQNYLGTERMRTMPTGPYNSSAPNYAVEANFADQPFGDNKKTFPGTVIETSFDTDANHYAFLDTDKETATDHADFRQYSNAQGRWMAPDPYDGSYDPSNPQSLNRYVYAANSPLSAIDPSGESVLLCAEGGDCYWLTDQQYLDALGSSNSGMYVPSLSELKREGTLSIMGTEGYIGVEGTVSYFNDIGPDYDASTPGSQWKSGINLTINPSITPSRLSVRATPPPAPKVKPPTISCILAPDASMELADEMNNANSAPGDESFSNDGTSEGIWLNLNPKRGQKGWVQQGDEAANAGMNGAALAADYVVAGGYCVTY
jgi:RHS repeat-associated protein